MITRSRDDIETKIKKISEERITNTGKLFGIMCLMLEVLIDIRDED